MHTQPAHSIPESDGVLGGRYRARHPESRGPSKLRTDTCTGAARTHVSLQTSVLNAEVGDA